VPSRGRRKRKGWRAVTETQGEKEVSESIHPHSSQERDQSLLAAEALRRRRALESSAYCPAGDGGEE